MPPHYPHHGPCVDRLFGPPPPHGPHHHPHPGHVTRIAYEGSVSRGEAGERLARVAAQLIDSTSVDFEEIRIDIPDTVDLHARVDNPHPGRTIIKFEVHFNEAGGENGGVIRPISQFASPADV
jgi:hypothetical protein